MHRHRARARLAVGLLVFLALAASVCALAGTEVALALAPGALLALLLLLGRYPGERVIRRLASRVAVVRARRQVSAPRAPRSLGARVAALAAPGAGRAPPAFGLI